MFFITKIVGQEYFPFPTENVNWNIYLLFTCDNDSPPDNSLLRYVIHGDTIINEILYSKLCLETGDTTNPTVEPVGGLREFEKQIFYRGLNFLGVNLIEQECLLYEFSKQVGDTIHHDSYGMFFSVIKEIDSIKISEDYRKRYKVDNHWCFHNPDYIESNYRADSLRIVAGFSNNAMFADYIMIKEPDLFKSFILISPMLGYADNYVLNETIDFFSNMQSFDKTLYVIYGDSDDRKVVDPMLQFEALLKDKTPKNLKWEIDILENEGHVPYIDVYNGLVYTFENLKKIN